MQMFLDEVPSSHLSTGQAAAEHCAYPPKLPSGRRLLAYCLLLLGTLSPCGLFGQGLTIDAYTDTTDYLIGDHIRLQFELSHPKGMLVQWPFFADTLGRIEVLGQTAIDTLEDESGITELKELTLTAFDSGTYRIPPVVFSYQTGPDNTLLQGSTSPILIDIHTVPVDTTQAIKPIKAPLAAPILFEEVLPWLLLALLLAGIAFAIYWFVLRKKKEVPVFVMPQAPQVPAHETAMRKLAELERKKLWQAGEIKGYYVELTGVLREYLEGRFDIHALESTTDEIMAEADSLSISTKMKGHLRELLQRADLAKFARYQPEPQDNLAGMEFAREFVKETRPKPPVAQAEAAPGGSAAPDVSPTNAE